MQVLSEHYRQIIKAFKTYLKLMGYAGYRLGGIHEFLRELEKKGKLSLAQISKEDIKSHYQYLQNRPGRSGALSPHTIKGYIGEIRLLLRWAEKTGQITLSPMAGMRFPNPPKSEREILISFSGKIFPLADTVSMMVR